MRSRRNRRLDLRSCVLTTSNTRSVTASKPRVFPIAIARYCWDMLERAFQYMAPEVARLLQAAESVLNTEAIRNNTADDNPHRKWHKSGATDKWPGKPERQVLDLSGGCGAPDRIRTCYRRLRSQIGLKFNVFYQLFV
jgi:hypothetical protein